MDRYPTGDDAAFAELFACSLRACGRSFGAFRPAPPTAFWLAAFGLPAPTPTPVDASFWVSLFVCLDLTLAWIAVPLIAAGLTLRRAFASGAAWKSALVGGAAGLFCGATMNLHCPNVDPAHMGLAHGIPVVVASALGALLLVRWLRA